MATKSISQLDSVTNVTASDLLEVAQPDSNSQSGYTSKQESIAQISSFIGNDVNFNGLNSTDKTLVGAINEVDAEGVKWTDQSVLGAKNLFQYPYRMHPKPGETYMQRGIAWTDNEDGGGIKANGINDGTNNSYCQILPTTESLGFQTLPAGKYHFSGGISKDYYLNLSTGLKTSPTERTELGTDYGEGFDFEVTETMAQNNIFCSFAFVKKDKSADNVVFYPMIRRLDDSDGTWKPYVMTNYELTKKVQELEAQIAALL